MGLYCDECGGSRLNGSGIVFESGDDGVEKYLSQHRPRSKPDQYWCRSCVLDLIERDDYDPHGDP